MDKADNISPADSTDHDERQDRGVDGLEPSATGHFDELRQTGPVAAASELKGPAARQDGLSAAISPHWAAFFSSLGPAPWESLNRRTESLQRQIRDNGITYNVYADAERPQRPWSLDLFPLIVSPESWQHIESGVK